MEGIEHWKLCDDYSIIQAALLACGRDPSSLQYDVEHNLSKRPQSYTAIRTAICNAIQAGNLTARYLNEGSNSFNNDNDLDLHATFVSATDLDIFFRTRGKICEFFDRSPLKTPNDFNPFGVYYPRKLSAALKAWTAVTANPASLRGKSPKQALARWLTEHAAELRLLNRNGKPNASGIEEICKVANWKPEGGAIPTPAPLPPSSDKEDVDFWASLEPDSQNGFRAAPQLADMADNSPRPRRLAFSADLDDEIPF